MPFLPSDSANLAAWYDFGDTSSLIKGGYNLNGTNQTLTRTASVPATTAPFWIVCWFKKNAVGSSGTILNLSDSGSSNYFGFGVTSAGDVPQIFAGAGATTTSKNCTVAITVNRWHCVITVFASSTSRAIYSDVETAGVSDTTSVTPSGVDRVTIGGFTTPNFAGTVAYMAVFQGAGPDSTQRSAIFAGGDPETVYGSAAEAVWTLDNVVTDSSGNGYDLTANNSPTAQNFLVVARDKSGNSCHLRATTSAPTWSSTAFSNYGGAAFSRASAQFLTGSTLPVTAAPLQVFAAARSSDTTNGQDIWNLAKSSTNNNFFLLEFRGDVASDPVFWLSNDGSSNGVSVVGYTANTDHLLYAREASSTSRAAAIDAGTEGTDTNSRSPSGINVQVVGKYGGSAGGSALDGQIGGIVILDTASTTDKSNFEGWFNDTYSLGLSLSSNYAGTATITGVGSLSATTFYGYGASATLTGVGSLTAASQADMGLSASITGTGSISANAVFAIDWAASASITGVGSLSGILAARYQNTSSITGSGSISLSSAQQMVSYAGLSGQGFLRSAAEQFRYQTANPPLSGDSVPVTNQSRFLLTVNTTPVSLGHPYYNMEELLISYDKKSLSFSEIATPGIGHPTWGPEANVRLQIDFDDGEGLITYFTGQINHRIHQGINNAEEIRYQAEGIQTLANRVTLTNTTGWPVVQFTVGTTVISVVNSTDITTTYAKTIKDAVLDVFTIMSSTLNVNSISSEIYTPTLTLLKGDLPETVVLSGQGFAQGVQQILSYAPGKRLFWDDPLQMWTFVDLVNAPILISQVESSQIEELTYDVSTEGRYTAIRLMADESALDDNIYTNTSTLETPRGTFQLTRETVDLTPYWDEVARATWSVWNMTTPFPQNMGDDWFWVYRRWQIPDNIQEEWPGTPITFFAQSQMVEGNASTLRWERFRARANFRRRTVISQYPIVQPWSNIWEQGSKHAGPLAVKMVYYPRGQVNGTVTTSVTTAGTPVTANTLFDSSFLLDQVRYPADGFQGTAYDLFNVQRELIELVSPTEVTTANAEAKLALLKDVIVSGDIPYRGDPVKSFMNLGLRIQVQHSSKLTGIQSFAGYQTQYRYAFGRPGTNFVGMTTDRGEVVG